VAAGPFRWRAQGEVRLLAWEPGLQQDRVTAECRYAGFLHRRRVIFQKPGLFLVIDEVEGPPGEHVVEQFWHAGSEVTALPGNCYRIGPRAVLVCEPEVTAKLARGFRSPVHGTKVDAPVIVVARLTALPLTWRTVLDLTGNNTVVGAMSW